MRTLLVILSVMVLLAGCEKESSSATPKPPYFTPEQVSQSLKLLKQASEKGKQVFDALDAARPTAPYVADFVRLFPKADVNHRYFTGTGDPGFNAVVELHGRYELTMQLPVHFDSARRNVIGYGEPNFYLSEIASRRGRSTTYNGAGERRFGSAEWKRIVDSGGDFGAIGYTMITDKPVPVLNEGENDEE